MNVVVIGGGIIGLLTARELSVAGCRVTVVERGLCGQEASWAGGGIVSPLYPWRYSEPVTALARVAQHLYPTLADELFAETGIDIELEHCGLLMLDAADADEARAWASRYEQVLEQMDGVELQRRFGGLADHWREGVWMPSISHVRNPRMLKALVQALRSSGVKIREHVEIVLSSLAGDSVKSVLSTGGEKFSADVFVICTGAWSSLLLPKLAEQAKPLPVHPVRGQMIQYRPASVPPCMIMSDGRYLIPRRDGHVLCGSTLEEAGFDKTTTEEAHKLLHDAAKKLWPPLANEKPIAQWAGLRPSSPNGVPFMGKIPCMENLWISAGHYRNGLVLAPASARFMADLILERESRVDPRPYQLGLL